MVTTSTLGAHTYLLSGDNFYTGVHTLTYTVVTTSTLECTHLLTHSVVTTSTLGIHTYSGDNFYTGVHTLTYSLSGDNFYTGYTHLQW